MRIYVARLCRVCGITLTLENEYPSNARNRHNLCKMCSNSLAKTWRKEHPGIHPLYVKRVEERVRRNVFYHYSGGSMSCADCSNGDVDVLTIDHVHGGGRKHRECVSRGKGGVAFYRWLIRENYPEGYAVRCMNCQFKRMKQQLRREAS